MCKKSVIKKNMKWINHALAIIKWDVWYDKVYYSWRYRHRLRQLPAPLDSQVEMVRSIYLIGK